MRTRQATYPVQSRWSYGRRLLKYAVLKLASPRPIFTTAVSVCRMLGGDYDRIIGDAARGFPGPSFFAQIRRQPSTPLLAMLWRRLRTFDAKHLAARIARGKMLAELLDQRVDCPAAGVLPHSYWAFPIVVDDPHHVTTTLARAGFDSARGHNLSAGKPPVDRQELDPSAARDALDRMIYLPCYPEMPNRALEQMARVLLQNRGSATGKPTDGEDAPS
jgi:dTDP-4-amino-4,6-dideoxygalactose transaminase